MTDRPNLTSVIMPVYNGAAFVGAAIESVLRQAHDPLQIIVVDDGSTDSSARLVRSFGSRIAYVYQPNKGPAAARNLGLSLAHGETIAFLDADDLWSESKLVQQHRYLATDATLDIVLSHTQFVHQGKGDGCRPSPVGDPYPQFFLGSALFRRSVFAQVGVFDETLFYCDDWDWFLRALELGIAMRMTPEIVLFYRRHDGNLTRNPESRRELLRMIQKSLKRRRLSGDSFALPEWFDLAHRIAADG